MKCLRILTCFLDSVTTPSFTVHKASSSVLIFFGVPSTADLPPFATSVDVLNGLYIPFSKTFSTANDLFGYKSSTRFVMLRRNVSVRFGNS